MTAVFDSNILIDFLDGVPEAQTALASQSSRAISIVTWIEVMVGARTPTAERRTRTLLARFDLMGLSPQIAERAAQLRRERRLKLPDAIIYATADELACPLLTRNTRDFNPDDPRIIVPYTLGS